MSQELKEPRQAGDPADLASNAALTDKLRNLTVNLTQPERLTRRNHWASCARRPGTAAGGHAIEARVRQAATEKCRDCAQDAPASVFNRLDEHGPEAMREVSRTMAVASGSATKQVSRPPARCCRPALRLALRGQADPVTALHAEHLKWLDAENRLSVLRSVSRIRSCVSVGWFDRAERSAGSSERGIA